MGHIPTKKQEEAFKKVVQAFKEAKKAGLVFYGKSSNLVAYKKSADSYIDEVGFEEAIRGYLDTVPYLSGYGCLSDSGSDDYAKYRSAEDEEKFNK